VTAVAPLNLNPKLERLLKLNQAYKGNGSKLDASYLEETIQTTKNGKSNKKKEF
jgi:hypothetical protein